jgi:hypothetical protein
LPVGKLYVNRGITGAVVGRHPFGAQMICCTSFGRAPARQTFCGEGTHRSWRVEAELAATIH